MKRFNSLKSRITLAIIAALLLNIIFIGALSYSRINDSFNDFIVTGEAEGFGMGMGMGRNQNDERRIARYEELVGNFEESIGSSLLIATLAGFILSLIIGVFISDRIASPLNDLKNKIKSLSKNSHEKIETSYSTKEIQELSTEFNGLVDELKRIEGLREDMVSDVAHELKTPLTKILGQIEGCIDGVYECDEKQLKKIINNVYHLEKLINTLQKIVEIRSLAGDLEIEEIDLRDLVDNILSGVDSKDLKIENLVPIDTKINADISKLVEIIENLVTNAIRYTEKGSVKIKFDNNKLSIIDTGIGIAEDDIPYIFERFYRTDKSRSIETGGFGLGLAIVKELVEAQGWEIEVESKVGEGSMFIVRF